MTLLFRIVFNISLFIAILAGCSTTGKIDETDSESILIQGAEYAKQGQYDRAIVFYSRAIELNPVFAKAYKNRGIVYFYQKKFEEAWNDVHTAQNLGYKVHPDF